MVRTGLFSGWWLGTSRCPGWAWAQGAVEVRLADGGSRCAGRVEVKQQGQWGTVCGNYWDMNDAAVICKQLGCGSAVGALQDGHFGQGSGTIWMDDVGCKGTESALSDCRHSGWGENDCKFYHDAGVMCSGKGKTYSPSLGLGLFKEPGCALRDQPSGTRALPNMAGHTAELGLVVAQPANTGTASPCFCPVTRSIPLECLNRPRPLWE
uniref:SRCR domain-containing protein n=1 Tax=Bubo bubo TaxID=30461 RepID=A0A8C0EVY7_BUBBB